jgi:hypothetical protein
VASVIINELSQHVFDVIVLAFLVYPCDMLIFEHNLKFYEMEPQQTYIQKHCIMG